MPRLFYRIWYRLFGILCPCGCGTFKPKGKLCARQAIALISRFIDEAWTEQEAQAPSPGLIAWHAEIDRLIEGSCPREFTVGGEE